MSFCIGVKNEIAETDYENCCNASHLYGVLSFAKSFRRETILLALPSEAAARHVLEVFRRFGIVLREDCIENRNRGFVISIKDRRISDRLLSDFGYSGDEPNYRIKQQNFMCERCKSAFAAGCFLAGGTVTKPVNGYHLEFSSHKLNLLSDLTELLESEGFRPKTAGRRARNRVLYFKDSAQIEDLLTYMGAPVSAMEIMEAKIEKDVMNNVNRRANCENANIDKTVFASANDSRLIEYILERSGEDCLPKDLLEVALLRLEYPELSLSELGTKTAGSLGKSGVSHRLRKIRAEARQLMEQDRNADRKA